MSSSDRRAAVTPIVKPASGSLSCDFNESIVHPHVVHRQRVRLIVEAPSVAKGEHMLEKWGGDRRLTAAVTSDTTRHHGGPEERVDVADRGQRSVGEQKKSRLVTVGQQDSDTASRQQHVQPARLRPDLRLKEAWALNENGHC